VSQPRPLGKDLAVRRLAHPGVPVIMMFGAERIFLDV
jgi:hypothetical protein